MLFVHELDRVLVKLAKYQLTDFGIRQCEETGTIAPATIGIRAIQREDQVYVRLKCMNPVSHQWLEVYEIEFPRDVADLDFHSDSQARVIGEAIICSFVLVKRLIMP